MISSLRHQRPVGPTHTLAWPPPSHAVAAGQAGAVSQALEKVHVALKGHASLWTFPLPRLLGGHSSVRASVSQSSEIQSTFLNSPEMRDSRQEEGSGWCAELSISESIYLHPSSSQAPGTRPEGASSRGPRISTCRRLCGPVTPPCPQQARQAEGHPGQDRERRQGQALSAGLTARAHSSSERHSHRPGDTEAGARAGDPGGPKSHS